MHAPPFSCSHSDFIDCLGKFKIPLLNWMCPWQRCMYVVSAMTVWAIWVEQGMVLPCRSKKSLKLFLCLTMYGHWLNLVASDTIQLCKVMAALGRHLELPSCSPQQRRVLLHKIKAMIAPGSSGMRVICPRMDTSLGKFNEEHNPELPVLNQPWRKACGVVDDTWRKAITPHEQPKQRYSERAQLRSWFFLGESEVNGHRTCNVEEPKLLDSECNSDVWLSTAKGYTCTVNCTMKCLIWSFPCSMHGSDIKAIWECSWEHSLKASRTNWYMSFGFRNYLPQLMDAKRSLLNEAMIEMKLLLAMPAKNISSKSSFNPMRHVKHYLRSTIGQESLNHLVVLHAHKTSTLLLNIDQVANYIVNGYESWQCLFGTFI